MASNQIISNTGIWFLYFRTIWDIGRLIIVVIKIYFAWKIILKRAIIKLFVLEDKPI